MATNESTTKFRVDISELKKNIQEANRQIRLANAEFKAASAGMDDWTKSTDGLSAKIGSLRTVLTNQNRVLDSYKRQLEKIVEEEGEGSKGAEEMRIKIANQQAAIGKTEKAIRDYTAQLDNLQKEQEASAKASNTQVSAYSKLASKVDDQQKHLAELKKQYASVVLEQGKDSKSAQALAKDIDALSADLRENKKALSDVEQEADKLDNSFDDVGESAGATSEGFTVMKGALAGIIASAVISGVKALGNAFKELAQSVAEATIEAAAYADEINTQAAVTGLSTDALQEYAYMADLVDVSVDTLTGSLTKLTRNMYSAKDGGTEAAEVFDALGVSIVDANGELRNNQDVFNEALDALGRVANETERDAMAMQIFGRSAQDLNPLIEAGSETIAALAEEAHNVGYVLDTDTLDGLNSVQDGIDRLTNMGDTLKRSLATVFAPIAEEMLTPVLEGMSGMQEAFQTDGLSGMIKAGVTAAADLVKDVLKTITEIAPEMVPELTHTVIDIIRMLTDSGVITALLDMIVEVAEILAEELPNVIAELAVTLVRVFPTITTTVLALLHSLIVTLTKNLLFGFIYRIPDMVTALFAGLNDMIPRLLALLMRDIDDQSIAAWTEIWEGAKTAALLGWEAIKTVFSTVALFFKATFKSAWEEVKSVFSSGGEVFTGITDGILSAFRAVVNGLIQGINALIVEPFNAINSALDAIRNVRIGGFAPFAGLLPSITVPQIPMLATGGVLRRGQVGLLEGDGAEAVVPLEDNAKWIAATARALKKSLKNEGIVAGGSAGGSGTAGTTINFNQTNNSPKALSRLEIYRQSKNLLNFAKGV